jgi:hypothetical protein
MKKLLIVLSAAALILAGCEELANTLLPDDDAGKTIFQSLAPGKDAPPDVSISHEETQEEPSGETVITYTLGGAIPPVNKNKFTPGGSVYKAFYEEDPAASRETPESILKKTGGVVDSKNGGKYTINALSWADLRRILLSAGLTVKDTFVVNEVNPGVFQESGIYSETAGERYPKPNIDTADLSDEEKSKLSYYHKGWVAGGIHAFNIRDSMFQKDAAYYFIAIDANTDGTGGTVNGTDPEVDGYTPPEPIELKFYKLIPAGDGTLPAYDSDTNAIPETTVDPDYTSTLRDTDYQLVLVLKFENRLQTVEN